MPFDPESYATGIRAENEREARAIARRAELARAEAARLAAKIASGDPSVQRVVLFGSLADGSPPTPHFDIDLAIDGGDLFRAMEIAEQSEFDVDIVTIACVPEHVQTSINQRGVVLYAADPAPDR